MTINLDPLVIGLAGRAGSGKDTAAAYLSSCHAFERYAFAEPMRDMLEQMLIAAGLDYAYLFEPHLKERPIPGIDVSYRHLAQTLGTEWGRKLIGEDFWLRLADCALGFPDSPIHDRIVVSDVRFPNEADWVRKRGGIVVRIDREVAPVRDHISEQLLDQIEPFRRIDNTGSIDQLTEQLDELLRSVKAYD